MKTIKKKKHRSKIATKSDLSERKKNEKFVLNENAEADIRNKLKLNSISRLFVPREKGNRRTTKAEPFTANK